MNSASMSEHTVEVARVGDAIMALLFGGCRVVIMDGKIRYEGWVPFVETPDDAAVFLDLFDWATKVRRLMVEGEDANVRMGEYEPSDFGVEAERLRKYLKPAPKSRS